MTTPPDNGRFRALLLTGIAHCGSTLLGRMLGRHADVLCVGEVMRMQEALELGFQCSCGASFAECEFWGPRAELFERYGNDYRRFDLGFFDELAAGAQRSLVFDTSKTRVWRTRRNWRSGQAATRTGFVFLLRDSRGVLAATKRNGRDISHAAPRHAKWIRRLSKFARQERQRTLVMTYEGLCRDPDGELRRLLDFIELDWDDELRRPADAVHHLVHASASRYLAGSNDVRRDERWRTELTATELAAIEREMRRVPALVEHYLDDDAPTFAYRDRLAADTPPLGRNE